MSQFESPTPPRPPIGSVIPPLILGTATFNHQYVEDPSRMPYVQVVAQALERGVRAFDTSPYYGPSEILLGDALGRLSDPPPRESYFLVTKAGRIASSEFDYSPQWIRYSVHRSLERLKTPYLDLVYTHDVEFVSPAEVVTAVKELRKLRDEGLIRYVGISGYPVHLLCDLAKLVLEETGAPLDAVLSYGHFSIQNGTLGHEDVLSAFKSSGVGVVLNASMLGMGLLTTRGADRGPMASWHPAPHELQVACRSLSDLATGAGQTLEKIAIRWALLNWARVGAVVGSQGTPRATLPRVGVSVMGVCSPAELEETCEVWESVLDELEGRSSSDEINNLVESRMWPSLGSWHDFSWPSPPPGFKNERTSADQVPEDDISRKYKLVKD